MDFTPGVMVLAGEDRGARVMDGEIWEKRGNGFEGAGGGDGSGV